MVSIRFCHEGVTVQSSGFKMQSSSALKQFLEGEKVSFELPGIVDVHFNFVSGILNRFLYALDIPFLTETILVVLKELLTNATRANAKRQFFQEKGLNLADPSDYAKGMEMFSEQVLARWKEYSAEHRESGYFLRLSFLLSETEIDIEIFNNVELAPREKERIGSRMKRFPAFRNIEAAFSSMSDTEEGAGLGLLMTLFLLKKSGIKPGNLSMKTGQGRTETRLRIPREAAPVEFKEKFRDEVLSTITRLPSLRENIVQLVEMCNSTTASIQLIGHELEKDPSLTAQLLKLVNSAGYMNRISRPNITDAIKVVGLKVLRNLLLVTGSREVLNRFSSSKNILKIWSDSNRVSFFARELARSLPGAQDSAPVAGLLHLLGKIVLLSLSPEVVGRVDSLMGGGKLLNSSLMEEMQLGISHPEIAALLAEKWQFPESLVVALRYQQKPLQTPEHYRELVYTVYLSIRILQTQQNTLDYQAVEPEVLGFFQIQKEEQYQDLVISLEKKFDALGSPEEE